jgi:hypothetical protein
MPTFQAKIVGLDRLQEALMNYPRIAEPILQSAIEASAAEAYAASRPVGVVPVRTGYLKNSFGKISGRLFARIGPSINYFVDYATIVHEGGEGRKANRYMPRILQAAQDKMNKHFKDALDKIVRAIAKS